MTTEQKAESCAKEYVDDIIQTVQDRSTESAEIDFYNGFCEGISQMQPQWIDISKKEECLKDGDKAWIEMDYSEWGSNKNRIEIAYVHFTKEPIGYGGPNALTGSGMLTGIYFSLPAIVNPDCIKRFCLIPHPPL